MAQAEALRLRRFAHRTTNRVIFAVVAAVFALSLLMALHVSLVLLLVRWMAPIFAVLIVAGIDLIVVSVCGWAALSSKPDRIEREALQVRREARAQLGEAFVMSAFVLPALSRAGFGLAGRLLGGSRRRRKT